MMRRGALRRIGEHMRARLINWPCFIVTLGLFVAQQAAAAQMEVARDRSLGAAPERPGTYL